MKKSLLFLTLILLLFVSMGPPTINCLVDVRVDKDNIAFYSTMYLPCYNLGHEEKGKTILDCRKTFIKLKLDKVVESVVYYYHDLYKCNNESLNSNPQWINSIFFKEKK